ncbi:flavin-containing monooxygenase [Aspergillus fijiensis CBS 313.89]|uniref:L-ornithine N(5)-monooxygenase n=1 Tax=Aspergillus fijiensis CBS 313.89 TaxID=1448319 RepID=A0A8G1RSM9_9EURO|nr:FAD/NAD(P)-binding domain-containing protein [Aspergillus fijiensis CBS 313.89]RAK78149.1 FAD/NAD(P)-binding domain-containing protein [Aspergillus fijiensis CBS 313.89]
MALGESGSRTATPALARTAPNPSTSSTTRRWSTSGSSERFPDHNEMRAYFQYVDRKWHVSQDYDFGVGVEGAAFQEDGLLWSISLSDGRCVTARFFIPAVGFASTPTLPKIPGIESFQGPLRHTADWPHSGLDVAGKRVAVIGTGASGAQVVARIAPQVQSLTVYQRTPVVAIPASPESAKDANLRTATPLTPDGSRAAFQRTMTSFSGLDYCFQDAASAAVGSPLRDLFNRQFYKEGSRALVWSNFTDVVDVREAPLTEITPTGIRSGKTHVEYDVIVCATGFQSNSAGIARLNITGSRGVPLTEVWKHRVCSYLGMTVPGFPNMFYLFGPQGPTVKVNLPTAIECQAQWILAFLKALRTARVTGCEPTLAAAQAWQEELRAHWKDTLYAKTTTWEARNASNQPEPLWIRGIHRYNEALQASQALSFRGFTELQPKRTSVL